MKIKTCVINHTFQYNPLNSSSNACCPDFGLKSVAISDIFPLSDWCRFFAIWLVPFLRYLTGAVSSLSDWCRFFAIWLVPFLRHLTGAVSSLSDWCRFFAVWLVPFLRYLTGVTNLQALKLCFQYRSLQSLGGSANSVSQASKHRLDKPCFGSSDIEYFGRNRIRMEATTGQFIGLIQTISALLLALAWYCTCHGIADRHIDTCQLQLPLTSLQGRSLRGLEFAMSLMT